MDSTITINYFRASEPPVGAKSFGDLLIEAISSDQNAGNREIEVNEKRLRIERCETNGDFIFGEFCRKQTSNIPPVASGNGLSPLPLSDGDGIGHMMAFRYHRPTRVIALQRNHNCASPIDLCTYIATISSGNLYSLSPIFRQDSWARMATGRPRRMDIKFANPDNLTFLDDDDVAVAAGGKRMMAAYNGSTVSISISVGNSRASALNRDGVMNTIRRMMGRDDVDVDAIKVHMAQDSGPAQIIDFVEDALKSKGVLQLDRLSPSDNFEKRKNFLQSEFSINMDYIRRLYGGPDGAGG